MGRGRIVHKWQSRMGTEEKYLNADTTGKPAEDSARQMFKRGELLEKKQCLFSMQQGLKIERFIDSANY